MLAKTGLADEIIPTNYALEDYSSAPCIKCNYNIVELLSRMCTAKNVSSKNYHRNIVWD